VAGDVRLMESERIKKDKTAKSLMVAENGLMSISRKRRRHMNGKNIGSVGPSMPRISEEEMRCTKCRTTPLFPGKRNEEETKAHYLSKGLSSPTAAITWSMMSCGMATETAICKVRDIHIPQTSRAERDSI